MTQSRILRLVICSVLLAGVVTSGCSSSRVVTGTTPDASSPSAADTTTPDPASGPTGDQASTIGWLDTPLTDAVTGESFRLSDYKGKPVLLHAFAAW